VRPRVDIRFHVGQSHVDRGGFAFLSAFDASSSQGFVLAVLCDVDPHRIPILFALLAPFFTTTGRSHWIVAVAEQTVVVE
jgi:hypothetical protein